MDCYSKNRDVVSEKDGVNVSEGLDPQPTNQSKNNGLDSISDVETVPAKGSARPRDKHGRFIRRPKSPRPASEVAWLEVDSSDEEILRSQSTKSIGQRTSAPSKRAREGEDEALEPNRAPKINTARRGRAVGVGHNNTGPRPRVPDAGGPGGSYRPTLPIQRSLSAGNLDVSAGTGEEERSPGQAGEAELEGTADLMREALAKEARDGLAVILAETTKSSNLKGTVVKAIEEAVRKVEGAVDFLHRGETATEAARRMSEDNRRMRGQLAALEAEVKVLRGAYSSAPTPCSSAEMHAGVREAIDDLRRDIFTSMRNMMDARLSDIERRLPAEVLRPPLGGRRGAPGDVTVPIAAAAATAPRVPPPASTLEPIPGPSPTRNAPAGPRPKKAKKKALPRKTAAAPPVAASADPAASDATAPTTTDQAEMPWSQVVGRKTKTPKKAKKAAATPQAARAKAAPKTAPRPRALATPKSSAVVITLRPEAVAEKGATYKGVLEAVTAAVDLGSLGIPHVRVRNTQTGARMVEVPGATSAEKADTLAAKLEEVIGGLATVTRPTKTADLRVTGLDESVTPEKIRAVVAAKGQCPQSTVSVGAVRLAPNGRGSAIVRCPVTAAQRVAAAGRMLVGWSSAGVHVMEPLPMRCFRCMGIGHTRALCPSSVDRSGLCFRCGQVGHSASGCTATPRCSVCTAARRPADHVMGGRSCAPPPTKGKPAGTSGPPPIEGQRQPQPLRQGTGPIGPGHGGVGGCGGCCGGAILCPPAGELGGGSGGDGGHSGVDCRKLPPSSGEGTRVRVRGGEVGRSHPNWGVLLSKPLPGPIPGIPGDPREGGEEGSSDAGVGIGGPQRQERGVGFSGHQCQRAKVGGWAAALGLVVLNRGHANTCVRRNGGSIVDITFATPSLAARVSGWQVLEDEETLSDHKYIRMRVSHAPPATASNTAPGRGFPKWALTRLDPELAEEAAMVQAWCPPPPPPATVDVDQKRSSSGKT
ncbi:uncharacterized protein LOC113230814 [Hyposmocoma kahamanoa]|uniref:uncharacterized protein LOC113230814 n=1 Tax=Hyposmocoma kahamanoa TaxID=1477025 RepID=UPI000E6D9EE8|nr:uncharacterized protein LOC113230814 [Hyposmocoma kahamanoa]